MNNKPFGWYIAGMIFEGNYGAQEAKDFENGLSKDGFEQKAIPLYTHPVEEQDESFDRTASHMAKEYVSWTSCVACGQRVTGDSIHTCSPQLKEQDTDCQYCKQGCIRCDARKQLTDELNNLKKENKFFKEILSEMDKQVYNIEFLKQPMQILEDGQIVPVFKELTDEEIAIIGDKCFGTMHYELWLRTNEFARAILRKANEK